MDIPKNIQSAIQENKLVIFAGSGLSSKFKLPSWKRLVEDVIESLDNDNYKSFIPLLENNLMSPVEVLEKLKKEHNQIIKYIKNNFNIKDGDYSLHKKIIELSGQIITTNYDNAFENASSNNIVPTIYTSDYNVSEINKTNEPYILKLHGSFAEADKCILFKEDYENLYSKETSSQQKLKSIFTEKTILFLGFSFNDPDINLIFNNLDKAFGNNNKHFIITNEPKEFASFKFLNTISILNYEQIDEFIDKCLILKKSTNLPIHIKETEIQKQDIAPVPRIAYLYPNPIDIDFKDEIPNISNLFESLNVELLIGALNIKTLNSIEDYDLLIVATKVFKSKLYIEDDNLISNLISPNELCKEIPNDNIPIVFITNEVIDIVDGYSIVNISSFKNAIINRFIYKALRCCDLNFSDTEISVYTKKLLDVQISKGLPVISNLYGNNRDLEIGKKSLSNVVGRIEEQASIAKKLLNIRKTNKFLNIKASGGVGKTTLIKKVTYELYNRGYFKEGAIFKSCETIKTYEDFEETLISGFNMSGIINFKEHLIENFSLNKKDLLITLDNFETVVNNLNKEEFSNAISLLQFATDYANIVLTSREKIMQADDFEDVYSLPALATDDALALFVTHYGKIEENEIIILRVDILEDILNNNPLAIKLVTKSRTRFRHIVELKNQLLTHFFKTTNEDYTQVYKNNADLNIERTKSIYQSINYSYITLNYKEKIAFELLNLFPDGISLSNFKKCFEKKNSLNNISDKEFRVLRDKSLVEDYNGTLQLQPIIRRFAENKFSIRPKETKQNYCTDAYKFNCFVLDIINLILKKKSLSEALKLYNNFKNNLLNVLSYIPEIKIDKKGLVREKKYLLNFIFEIDDYIANEKQIQEFQEKLNGLQLFFSDIPNAERLVKVLNYRKTYYYKEFDNSYKQLAKFHSVQEMQDRIFDKEDYIENSYRNLISMVHSMEGYTLQMIKLFINNNFTPYFDYAFFYLGIPDSISSEKDGFYFFEYELMFKKLEIKKLVKYINSLYQDENLEIMQCTYTLSKVQKLDKPRIQKLVVTNPYTKGLKELMFAFIAENNEEKINHFENALEHLAHIKYYYLEALYYYCLFLIDNNYVDFKIKLNVGLELSNKFYYQYLFFLFSNIEKDTTSVYSFDYSFYPLEGLEEFVKKHNQKWEKEFKESEIDK